MNTPNLSPSSSTSLKTKPQNPNLKNKTIRQKNNPRIGSNLLKTTQELNKKKKKPHNLESRKLSL